MKSTAIIAGAAFALGLLAALAWSLLNQPAGRGGVERAERSEVVPPPAAPLGAQPAATDSTLAAPAPGAARAPVPTAAATAVLPAPLPPIGAPLADVLAELEQRARAGEAPAACRLAAELSRCGSLERRRQIRGMVDPVANPQGRRDGGRPDGDGVPDWQIEAAARLDVGIETDEQVCAGISREQSRNSLPWLYEAARLGSLPAMTSFARASWWNDGSAVHHPQILERYRAEAATMAEAAIAAGDRTMLAPLGLALAGSPGPFNMLSEVVEPDPVRARALLLLASGDPGAANAQAGGRRGIRGADLVRRAIDQLDTQLDAAAIAASEAQAAQLRAALDSRPQPPSPAASVRAFDGVGGMRPEDCVR